MAKSKNFFGLRRGSTKSLTFSVLNGQQVTKDRVYGGKNPRTLAQMNQRMAMATSSAAYAAMREIVDHSFEGISYGANTMAKFIELNTKLIKTNESAVTQQFGFNPYGDRALLMGAYKMSAGSASAIVPGDDAAIKTDGGHVAVSIHDNAAGSGAAGFTADSFMERYGVKVGDMITAVFIAAKDGSPENIFGFVRFKFVKAGDVVLTSENLSQYIEIESNLAGTITVNKAGFGIIFTSSAVVDYAVSPCTGWIHSAHVNGQWTRSNVTLDVPAGVDYQFSYDDAIATYPVGESYVLNGGELE